MTYKIAELPWQTEVVPVYLDTKEVRVWNPGDERAGARPTSGLADLLIGHAFKVDGLEHGTVELVDYMGIDRTIAETARTSYQRGTKSRLDDEQLVEYLIGHHHTTPVESCEMRVLINAPLFVIQQLLRQRTANINQESLRYSAPSEDRFHPPLRRMVHQDKKNKQGSGNEPLPGDDIRKADAIILNVNDVSRCAARDLEELKLAREIARTVVNVGTYSRLSFKLDAHNLGQLLMQRLDPHAQPETQNVIKTIHDLMLAWIPATTLALLNHRVNALRLSDDEVKRIKAWRQGLFAKGMIVVTPTIADEIPLFAGLSTRGAGEFRAKLLRLGLL